MVAIKEGFTSHPANQTLSQTLKRTRPIFPKKLLLALTVITMVVGTVYCFLQPMGRYVIRNFILPRIEEQFRCTIQVEDIFLSTQTIKLHEVTLSNKQALDLPIESIHFQEILIAWDPWKIWRGYVVLEELRLQGAHLALRLSSLDRTPWMRLLERLQKHQGATSGTHQSQAFIHGPTTIVLQDLVLDVQTPMFDLHLGSLNISFQKGQPTALHLKDGEFKLPQGKTFTWHQISFALPQKWNQNSLPQLLSITLEGGATTPWKHLMLTGIRGNVSLDPTNLHRVWLDLHGSYDNLTQEFWEAKGWIDRDLTQAEIRLDANQFPLSSLGPMLHKIPFVVNEDAKIGAQFLIRHQPHITHFDGSFHVANLSLFHSLLALDPLFPIELEFTGQGYIENGTHLVFEKTSLRSHGVTLELEMKADSQLPIIPPNLSKGPDPQSWRERWRNLLLHVKIPPVSCQTLFDAIPKALIPKLNGFQLGGQFSADLTLQVDFARLLRLSPIVDELLQAPEDTTLPSEQVSHDQEVTRDRPSSDPSLHTNPVTLIGNVGIGHCVVIKSPKEVSVQKLQNSFEHHVEMLPGTWHSFWVGPQNPKFIPYSQISPYFIHSILTTEDSNFMHHRGFIISEFRSALQKNLEYGSFRFGASSITMQMIKNVFLKKEKTLSRKLQELFLTWYLEQDQHLSKQRILEIYFNVIEFGPGIYGIGSAAAHYFGKHPRDLTPREAAWFSSILPNPKKRYTHYCRGAPSDRWEKYLDRILNHMHERKRLTDEEFQQALQDRLIFSRAGFISSSKCLAQIQQFSSKASFVIGQNLRDTP